MSKNHYKVELVAKTKVREYQMRTISYPKLSLLQDYKVIIKSPMKFFSVTDGFATLFSLKSISDKIQF